jgi:Rrf2 family cysteine metabolism transcriptional repressor
MIVSVKAQYGLRAVLEIACHDGLVTIAEVAEAQRVPRRYLEGILNQLRKAGMLDVRRGRRGGYRLGRNPAQIRVGDIVRLIDGPIQPVVCQQDQGSRDCPMSDACAFQPTWQRVQAAMNEALNATTFAELIEMTRHSRSAGALSYSI